MGICLFTDGFNSVSALILTTAVKQCIGIGARPPVYAIISMDWVQLSRFHLNTETETSF
jgi:hypothetical protein